MTVMGVFQSTWKETCLITTSYFSIPTGRLITASATAKRLMLPHNYAYLLCKKWQHKNNILGVLFLDVTI